MQFRDTLAPHISPATTKRPKLPAASDKISAFRKAVADLDLDDARLTEALRLFTQQKSRTPGK